MTNPTSPVLRAQGLTKRYGGALALLDFRLELAPGEVVALVGHNGAGKSTASKIMAGFVRPDEGSLEIAGETVERWSPWQARKHGVALVPQQFSIVPEITVAENISLGGRVDREVLNSVAVELGLEQVMSRHASEVSPATHRLTMIGRALVRDPRVIILDEPTAAFSSAETERLFAIIERLRDRGIAAIYISHRLQEVLDISDRVLGMSAGAIICDQPSSELTKDALADIISGNHGSLLERRAVTQAESESSSGNQEVLMRVRGMCTPEKLRDVNFEVHRGEVLGITGLIGAGRSSLLNTLWGMYGQPEAEVLELAGVPFVPSSAMASVRQGLAFVPEGRMRTSVIPDLNVTENVTLATLRVGRKFKNPLLNKFAEIKIVSKMLNALDTKPEGAARMQMSELSGGNQQKVVIARWLLSDAQVFMFDEPTEGVDIAARREIYSVIRDLAGKGSAVIISSSDVEEVVEFTDRILIMRGGELVEEIPREHQNVAYVSRACL
ncbi:sugar ABC transporter ATP-binding protein [Candidatus Aquiluna sp. UB-MaderosW2red]|uniref:sugar ABC transporter ATP-binding protein n=1 Tax=Candidatus Aquiluna sp. UB-MaderosW2red TaxID=1855377 RepID=UPI000875C2D7|nr:sugar ABC transporter ATP-binding protein [Candidatus Aquiluna sp. UB-MaderosW2red]SCX05273.1 ribose transport system ATP-binding protein/rhamnose transport system ATP-binding protein [Candidatus Aquiluna sp. UB-MaderosW2red]